MKITNWDEAKAGAKELQKLSHFIADDIKADHMEAAIRWADDAAGIAGQIRDFIKANSKAEVTEGSFGKIDQLLVKLRDAGKIR